MHWNYTLYAQWRNCIFFHSICNTDTMSWSTFQIPSVLDSVLIAGWKRCQARRHERFILAAEKSMANHLWRLQEGHEARKTGKSSRMHYITYSFLYHHKPFHTSSCTPLDKYHLYYTHLTTLLPPDSPWRPVSYKKIWKFFSLCFTPFYTKTHIYSG